MFENLRNAFREAIDNFQRELNRDDVPEAVDRLLVSMRNEATEAKTRLHDLENAVARAREEATQESDEAATCRRRESMARDIGDEETAEVAAEYARRHEERADVLRRKAAALEEELEQRRAEIEQMIEKIREAQKNRGALAAKLGRSSARESIRESTDLFDELDRMAEKIQSDGQRRRAEADLDFDLSGGSDYTIDLDAPPPPEPDLDARLAELKRRMKEE